MDRTETYIRLITEQPLIVAPVFILFAIFFMIPRHKRLFVTLLILVPWLTIARSSGFGAFSSLAKFSSGAAYLLIAFSAATHPGPKRQIPTVVWLFVGVACLGFVYILSVNELLLAVILRSQWLCVTLAGVFTVRTLVSYSDLRRLVDALTLGCIVALSMPISSLILFPGESFLRGMGRFEPWGANSNQTGMLFALAVPLLAYAALTHKRTSLRPFFLMLVMLTVGMALLTASRQTMIAIFMVTLPIVLVVSKRPVIMIAAMALGAIALPFIFSLGSEANFERFSSLQTGRIEIWVDYWTNVFPKRPLFGLLGTSGESYFKSVNEVGMHPHNAWFYLMYVGGATFALPMVFLTIYSIFCGIKMWKVRQYLPGDSLLYSVLVMLLIAMYVQGLFNQVVYWPTYTWSYLHVVLASFFICVWQDIRDGNLQGALYDDESWNEYESQDQEVEEFEDFDDGAHLPTS
jgi:hypothetical protein